MPQQSFTLPSLNMRPGQQTEEQKEAVRLRLERRKQRLESMRKKSSGNQDPEGPEG